MPEIIWAVNCLRVITDEATNATSFIDTLEEIGCLSLPFEKFKFVCCSLWKSVRDEDKLLVKIEFISPRNVVLVNYCPVDPFVFKQSRLRLNVHILVEKISEEGEHHVVISIPKKGSGWKQVRSLPIEIKLRPAKKS